jgi:hypothetical protein
LPELTGYGATARRFSSLLWIAYRVRGQPRDSAFATNVAIPGGRVWEETIRRRARP